MDNDNKINLDNEKKSYSLHEQVMLFLGDEVNRIHQDVETNTYNIEDEYAKTTKNHSPFNILVLVGVFIVVIATVFFVNKYITQKDQEITVSLDEFEDLNLSNLLNTVSSAQVHYDDALKAKLILETEYETKLDSFKDNYENELYILDSLNLSDKKEYNRRKSNIKYRYNENINELEEEYEEKLLLAQKQVDVYKAQLDKFDSVKVANAQEKEKLLNSERQLKQLEIDKLKKSYESQIGNLELTLKNMRSDNSSEIRNAVHNVATKYQAEIDTLDPKLNDQKANEIMSGLKETTDFDGLSSITEAEINEEAVVKSVSQYQDLYNDYKYLDDVIKSIPQKHSIPDYISATRNLVNSMGKTYVDTSLGYYQDIVTKRSEITELNNIVDEQTVTIKEQENHIAEQENHIAEQENHIAEQESQIAEQKNQIAEQKNHIAEQENYYETTLENAKNETTNYISVIFKSLQTDCIVLAVDENKGIQVAVSPEAKVLISNDGIPARIKLSSELINAENPDNKQSSGRKKKSKKKSTEELDNNFYIEGIIVPDANGLYYFNIVNIEKDADGNPILVDSSFIRPGMSVEIVKTTIN